jgi:membrane protease YdiL (CAAX protease family)
MASGLSPPASGNLMIQRLLRGQALYIVLGGLLVVLYMRAAHVAPVPPFDAAPGQPAARAAQAPPASGDDPLQLLPSREDFQRLSEAMLEEPLLAALLWMLSTFMITLSVGGVAMAVSGVRTGRIREVWRYPSRRLPPWSFGELGRITALAFIVISALPLIRLATPLRHLATKTDEHRWLALSMLVLHACVVFAILAFAVGKNRSVARTLGFSGRQLGPSLVAAARGYVAVFPWLFVLLIATVEAFRALGIRPPVEPIQELIFQEEDPGVLALTVLLACLVGPAAEELFFRGVLYPAIRQRTSRLIGLLVSGAAFSLIHTNPLGFLPIFLIGCLLADLYERTGSLAAPLAVHIVHNAFLLSLALLVRRLLLVGTS